MTNCLDIVKKLENKSNYERRNEIIQILKDKKNNFILENYNFQGRKRISKDQKKILFGNKGRKGTNIIVELGKGSKYIIVSAHYDAVRNSPGANDDASGVAVLIKLAEKLKNKKLNNKIKLIFFGDEENGRLGSLCYIKKHGFKDLIGIYNLELVGMGDCIGLWPITRKNKKSFLLDEIEKVANNKDIYIERVGQLPAFYGDDKSFRDNGFKHSFSISAVFKKDKDKIKKFVKSSIPMILIRYSLGLVPKMFKLYHSTEDKSKYLNESAMEMTLNLILETLINIDKKIK